MQTYPGRPNIFISQYCTVGVLYSEPYVLCSHVIENKVKKNRRQFSQELHHPRGRATKDPSLLITHFTIDNVGKILCQAKLTTRITMMYKMFALSLVLTAQVADAFQPLAFVPKSPASTGTSNVWRAPMSTKMVAGGAERAYGGEEYYEGKFSVV